MDELSCIFRNMIIPKDSILNVALITMVSRLEWDHCQIETVTRKD